MSYAAAVLPTLHYNYLALRTWRGGDWMRLTNARVDATPDYNQALHTPASSSQPLRTTFLTGSGAGVDKEEHGVQSTVCCGAAVLGPSFKPALS